MAYNSHLGRQYFATILPCCFWTCTFSATSEVHPDPKDTGYHLSIEPKNEKQMGVNIEQQYFFG